MHVERIGPVSLTGVVGSPNYYARYRKNGKQVTRSLGTTDVHEARRQVELIAEKLGHRKIKEKADFSFRRFALDTIEADRKKVQRGERAVSLVTFNEWILKKYLVDRIGAIDVRKIDYQRMQEVVDELTDLELASASIKRIMVLVSKTLKTAVRMNVLSHMPLMPEVSLKPRTRGWFTATLGGTHDIITHPSQESLGDGRPTVYILTQERALVLPRRVGGHPSFEAWNRNPPWKCT